MASLNEHRTTAAIKDETPGQNFNSVSVVPDQSAMVEVARNYREGVSWDRVDVAGDLVGYTRPAARQGRADLLALRDPNDGAAHALRLSDIY